MKNNTFLVTGGCGFIGSHLVDRLLKENCKVIIIDDLSTGYLKNVNENDKNLEIYVNEVENFNFNLLGKVDGVFHLAAQASVPISIKSFFNSSKSNMLSTFKIIEFCENKTIPLVYASSSAIYGNLPFGKEDGDIHLLNPYSADKFSTEMYLSSSNNINNLPSFGLRFFNVYGPKQDSSSPYSGVISIFINRILNNKPLTINGGYQTRDFIYVDDVINCIINAFNYLKNNKNAYVSNVLTGKSISINFLVENLSKILNVKPVCNYKDLQKGDPELSEGCVKKMKSFFDMNSYNFVTLKKGLEKTIKWEKN
tara:strand:- start:326 stop:1255 length:930 start_codon:yes stop_codon:yes gene_type:complete